MFRIDYRVNKFDMKAIRWRFVDYSKNIENNFT